MTEIDMTFETREELIRRDSMEEGKKQVIASMISKGLLTVTQGAEELGISEEELRKEI